MKTATRTNKYAADCANCGTRIDAGAGRLHREDGRWITQCADTDTCTATTQGAFADREALLAEAGVTAKAEYARRKAAGESPSWLVVLAETQRKALARPSTKTHTATTSRRRACVTGGNCSSVTGRDCGGHDCDANRS